MSTGRPPHEPTPALRRLVEHHAATGTLHRQIAKLLGLSLNTLKKHYREELDLGLARANAVVSGTLFAEAKMHVELGRARQRPSDFHCARRDVDQQTEDSPVG